MRESTPVIGCRLDPQLAKLMESCGRCNNCSAGNENLVAVRDMRTEAHFAIECQQCLHTGEWSSSFEGAVREWRNAKY